jgi:hypothetical protein
MIKFPLILCFLLSCSVLYAGTITGFVKDDKGKPLSYASVYIKNAKQGTTTGVNGYYQLSLPPGSYTMVVQHVGYAKSEKMVELKEETLHIDFTLTIQQVTLSEVIVKSGAEDPAYQIIRNAIKKRKFHLAELDHFSSEVYTKEQLQLRDFPGKFMGKKVDFEDGDTSKKKILYLSETVARYSVKPPDKTKLEVLSTRVSGSSNSFGLSLPKIINFYQNNIEAEGLNPRGFISPISDNALHYYRYHFEGSFYEDGIEINRIKVIPKRKFEPLFSGYILITENEWRIHSLQLELFKSSQMEILDTLRIEQLYAPLNKDAWVIRNQVLYPAVKVFGFDAFGSSVTVYSKFDLEADFSPKYFNNTIIKYNEGSNKKPPSYWDSIRPLPLQTEELIDFHKKDSLEQVRKNPHYLDSIDRIRNKVSIVGLLFAGETFSNQKRRSLYTIKPLIQSVSFNTVEGWVANLSGSWSKRLDSSGTDKMISISPNIRYGFSGKHLYGRVSGTYSFGGKYHTSIDVAGGKYVFQYNNANPIGSFVNTFSTLLWEQNHMKLYEAWFGRIGYSKELGNGFNFSAGLQYQDRGPLDNTTDNSWRDIKERNYSPNYPVELTNAPITRHQAFIANLNINWQPGIRYIEFPDRKMDLGSRYPVFHLRFIKGINNIFGSDVNYLKWNSGINDDVNLKLGGVFQYNVSIGGFLQKKSVQIPDYNHFTGNRTVLVTSYFNSFQSLPYYQYSNTENLFAEAHLEHHFNGMLTNKIPGFRKLNWYLVGGANALWLDGNTHYEEVFLGLENIFKILRMDVVWAFDQGVSQGAYFRVSLKGVLSGND